jgi:hypothetical protein
MGRGRGGPGMPANGGFGMHVEQRPPPPNYICFRCRQPGHWINQCPTNGDPAYDVQKVKKATGIPRSMLKTVSATDAKATLLLPGSGLVEFVPNEFVLFDLNISVFRLVLF